MSNSMIHTLGCSSDYRRSPCVSDTLVDCYIKVSVDDFSFRKSENVGVGGLLRDTNGIWIHNFSKICGRASNLFVKISTIWQGLCLAWNLGYMSIILEITSMRLYI